MFSGVLTETKRSYRTAAEKGGALTVNSLVAKLAGRKDSELV